MNSIIKSAKEYWKKVNLSPERFVERSCIALRIIRRIEQEKSTLI